MKERDSDKKNYKPQRQKCWETGVQKKPNLQRDIRFKVRRKRDDEAEERKSE